MATTDDIWRLDAHLQPLAAIIHAAASEVSVPWVAVVLDARFSDADGSISNKVRVERGDGSLASVSLPAEGTLRLIELGQARPSGPDRWHGLVLRVTAAGECEMRFNYDPACADDPAFYAS